jgi:hypothetical protein
MFSLLSLQDLRERVREREGAALVVLRRVRVQTDDAGFEVDVAPLQRQNLARDAPSGDIRELYGRTNRRRQVADDPDDLPRSKKPVRTFRSFSIGMCGTWVSFPFCRARLRMRLSVVSSGLISPFETFRSVWSSPAPNAITSLRRFRMNVLTSAVVIISTERLEATVLQ